MNAQGAIVHMYVHMRMHKELWYICTYVCECTRMYGRSVDTHHYPYLEVFVVFGLLLVLGVVVHHHGKHVHQGSGQVGIGRLDQLLCMYACTHTY